MATFVVNGRTVTAERNQKLLRFLRDEQKFDSVDQLRAQIQADAAASLPIAQAYIAEKSAELLWIPPLQPGDGVV